MNDAPSPFLRPRSNAAERAQWVKQFEQSGLSRREFAGQHSLKLSTLHRWLAGSARRASPAKRRRSLSRAATGFAEVNLPALAWRWAAEVVRTDGTVLRLAHDAPARLLEQLLGAC